MLDLFKMTVVNREGILTKVKKYQKYLGYLNYMLFHTVSLIEKIKNLLIWSHY